MHNTQYDSSRLNLSFKNDLANAYQYQLVSSVMLYGMEAFVFFLIKR